jgi:hypothetical protein
MPLFYAWKVIICDTIISSDNFLCSNLLKRIEQMLEVFSILPANGENILGIQYGGIFGSKPTIRFSSVHHFRNPKKYKKRIFFLLSLHDDFT